MRSVLPHYSPSVATPMPTTPSTPGQPELAQLEAAAVKALRTRDHSALKILGYGEVSVALGWPVDEPTFVCKRTPPFNRHAFSSYEQLVNEYIASVRASGLDVVDTTVVPLERGDQIVAYLVQPKLDAATLGENVLKAAEPDAEHPFVVALAEALNIVTPTMSIDAQVTNFAWDGSALTLIDVGTPFLWDNAGKLRFQIKPFARMLPAPTRTLATRELAKLIERWNDPRTVGLDIVANLYREGLDDWIDPMVVAVNTHGGLAEPVTASEAHGIYQEDLKIWPTLKKLQAVERWWQTSVRRRPYDWFIFSTFE